MKSAFTFARQIGIASAALTSILQAQATTLFSDNFTSGASPLWGNEVGNWVASSGVYRASQPANAPATYTSLPYNLTDFSIDLDVNSVSDGGIWLRSAAAPGTSVGVKGILFNLQTVGGSKVYWHIVTNGNDWGPAVNLTYLSYGTSPHVHIEVSGNTYSAFLNGSSTAASTLTTSAFSSGRAGLYDFSLQSFDNVVLNAVPEPAVSLLLVIGGAAALYCARRRRNRTFSGCDYEKRNIHSELAF